MKKVKFLILLFLILIIPYKVKALSPSQILTCNSNNLTNDIITCEYYVDVGSSSINGITTKYSYDSNLISISFTAVGTWQGNANGNRIDYYNYEDYTGKVHISTIKIKLKDGISVKEDTTTLLKLNLLELSDQDSKANKFDLNDSYSFVIKKVSLPPTKETTTTKQTTTSSIKTTTSKKMTTKENKVTSNNENKTTSNVTNTEVTNTTKKKNHFNTTKELNTESKKNKKTKKCFSWLIIFILLLIAILLIRKINKLIKEEKENKNLTK